MFKGLIGKWLARPYRADPGKARAALSQTQAQLGNPLDFAGIIGQLE
jgi:hypothetical protein